jgi:hypothetical protein
MKISALDDPFDDEISLLRDFVAYLREKRVPAAFLPTFEAQACAFGARFYHHAASELDAAMLEIHVEEGHLEALSERALRNRRHAGQAYLDFLRQRHFRPPGPPAAAPRRAQSDKRRAPRVPFVTEVRVDDYGVLRSADLSVGGMYLEKLTLATRGTPLRVGFRLRPSDAAPIVATARVSFVHPQFGAGVEFVSLAPADARIIADFVARACADRC